MNRVTLSPEYFPSPTIGRPISGASIYVGVADTDPEIEINQKQISIQQEDGSIIPVAQPVSTGGGGVPLYDGAPVTILVEGDYSLKVNDKDGSQVYYVPNVAYPLPLAMEYLSNYTSLAAAVAAIGSTETELWIDTDDILAGDVTIPTTLSLRFVRGSTIDGAFTFNHNGSLKAGSYQLFGSLLTTVFDNSVELDPEWGYGTDTEKSQWSLDTASASGRPVIVLHRSYAIASELKYNDANIIPGQKIRGVGGKAGYYTDQAINIFGTDTVITTAPTQNGLTFDNIYFEADTPSLACHAIDGDAMLRIAFDGCSFNNIRCAYTANYFQSWRFTNCKLLNINHYFMESAGIATDIQFINNFFEDFGATADGGGFKATSFSGCSFIGNVYEGTNMQYPFISAGQMSGVIIAGNYFEGVHDYTTGGDYASQIGGRVLELGRTCAVHITGNWFQCATVDAGSYEIWLDDTISVSSGYLTVVTSGNYSRYNFINNDDITTLDDWNIDSTGDESGLGVLFSEPYFANRGKTIGDTLVIATDTAVIIPIAAIGTILLASSTPAVGGLFQWRRDSARFLQTVGTLFADMALVIDTVLTGTTGTVGKVTLSAHVNGNLYIENRRASTLTLMYRIDGY